MDLSKQIILLTGGNGGIGNAIANDLLMHGAQVAIHYNQNTANTEATKATFGSQAALFQADISQPQQCQQLVTDVIDHFGQLNGLVNNAGITLKSPLNTNSNKWADDWQKTQDTNLMAPGILSKEAVAAFRRQDQGGRIIFISSRAAFRGDTPEFWAYAASKGGMHSLNKSIARYFGKEGIQSFEVAPGFVATPMAEEFIKTYGEEHVKGDLALNEMTQPSDIANWITFLASGKADHATGTTIDVNAGSYMH